MHSTPPLGGEFPSEYCCDVRYGKIRMVWLPEGEKYWRYVICFDKMHVYERDRHTGRQTDGHRMTAKPRPRLYSIAQQKMVIKQQKLMLKTSMEVTTVVRAQNDTSKTANITDTIFDRTLYSPYKRRRFENRWDQTFCILLITDVLSVIASANLRQRQRQN